MQRLLDMDALAQNPHESSDRENIEPRATTAIDLNDDCLLEVFQHLNTTDLAAVADVCHRFRQVAQAHFVSKGDKKLDFAPIFKYESDGESAMYALLHISRILRNFGDSIESIRVCEAMVRFPVELNGRPNTRLYNLGRLEHLRLDDERYTRKENSKRSNRIWWLCRSLGKPIIKILSQQWPELKTLSFENSFLYDISNEDIEEVLVKNSQLRTLLLRNCKYIEGDGVIQSMAAHTPLIEHFRFVNSGLFGCRGDVSLSELRNLKRLNIHNAMGPFETVLPALATASSLLEHVFVNSKGYYVHPQFRAQIVEAFKRFKKLETLWSHNFFHGLSASDMINIVENSIELANLKLNGCDMKGDILLELIRKGKNIQKLNILRGCWRGIVNIDVFCELVNIVQNRREKKHLEVFLRDDQISVPEDLLEAHSEHVTFITRSGLFETDETMFGFYETVGQGRREQLHFPYSN